MLGGGLEEVLARLSLMDRRPKGFLIFFCATRCPRSQPRVCLHSGYLWVFRLSVLTGFPGVEQGRGWPGYV